MPDTVQGAACTLCGRTKRWKRRNVVGIRPCAHCCAEPLPVRGVYPPITPDELSEMRRRMPSGTYDEVRLFYAMEATSGVLHRLYRAVLATPLEGSELREAMQETQKALGLTP